MKNTHEFISKVYDLIKDPKSFTTNWFARDNEGRSVSWDDPGAVRYDLIGAVEKIGASEPALKEQVFVELREKVPHEFGPLYKFAERGGHEQVVAFLNRLLNPDGKMPVEKNADVSIPENNVAPNSGEKVEKNLQPVVTKRRGRPKGSKNKPKGK
jgi:hypothetical protein